MSLFILSIIFLLCQNVIDVSCMYQYEENSEDDTYPPDKEPNQAKAQNP